MPSLDMAEAMLDPEYRAATLPPLPPPPPVSNNEVENSNATTCPIKSEPTEKDTDYKISNERTVVINVPPKKQKVTAESTVKRFVEGINLSVSLGDRVAAITSACNSFDHGIEFVHDEEIIAGADVALFKHLAFLLLKENNIEYQMKQKRKVVMNREKREDSSFSLSENLSSNNTNEQHHKDIIGEISQTCEGLELVYRCSPDFVSKSFSRIGSELLPLLIRIIDGELRRRHDKVKATDKFARNNKQTPDVTPSAIISSNDDFCSDHPSNKTSSGSDLSVTSECSTISVENISKKDSSNYYDFVDGDMTLIKCTKIMGHYARVGILTEPLARHPGLLSALKRLINCSFGLVPVESRLNALWVIANLACNADNMVMMANHRNLLEMLVQAALRPTPEDEEQFDNITQYVHVLRCKSTAVRAILNLSWAPENKIPMSEHINLVESLMQAITYRKSSWCGRGRGVSAILLQSRQHAAGALRNLAAAPRRNKIHLCRLNDGSLLDKLSVTARDDPDKDVRDRVVAALHNLSSSDTAPLFVQRIVLLETLADNAVIEGESGALASRALRVLEKSIVPEMKGYKKLRQLLDRVSTSSPATTAVPV